MSFITSVYLSNFACLTNLAFFLCKMSGSNTYIKVIMKRNMSGVYGLRALTSLEEGSVLPSPAGGQNMLPVACPLLPVLCFLDMEEASTQAAVSFVALSSASRKGLGPPEEDPQTLSLLLMCLCPVCCRGLSELGLLEARSVLSS